jgi:anti-sigma factor RsiW
MRSSWPEPHTMAGAYVLDALDELDRGRFEQHLARCQECCREVGGLREATARLAVAAAVQPTASLKDRLLAQTVMSRQLPPLTRGAPDRPARHRGMTGRTWVRRPLARRVWVATVTLALAGVFLIAATAVWVTANAGQPPPAQETPRGHVIAAVLTAPDATMISALVRTGGTATVVMSHRERTLVFAAAGLRALPASRRYELWLMGPGRDRPAGLLPLPRHGMTGPVIAPGLETGDRLGLSVEPASGSRQPTSAMIMVIAL